MFFCLAKIGSVMTLLDPMLLYWSDRAAERPGPDPGRAGSSPIRTRWLIMSGNPGGGRLLQYHRLSYDTLDFHIS